MPAESKKAKIKIKPIKKARKKRELPQGLVAAREANKVNPDILREIARAVYIDGLKRGGNGNYTMEDDKITKNSTIYDPVVRATLKHCVEVGLINKEDLQ